MQVTTLATECLGRFGCKNGFFFITIKSRISYIATMQWSLTTNSAYLPLLKPTFYQIFKLSEEAPSNLQPSLPSSPLRLRTIPSLPILQRDVLEEEVAAWNEWIHWFFLATFCVTKKQQQITLPKTNSSPWKCMDSLWGGLFSGRRKRHEPWVNLSGDIDMILISWLMT